MINNNLEFSKIAAPLPLFYIPFFEESFKVSTRPFYQSMFFIKYQQNICTLPVQGKGTIFIRCWYLFEVSMEFCSLYFFSAISCNFSLMK